MPLEAFTHSFGVITKRADDVNDAAKLGKLHQRLPLTLAYFFFFLTVNDHSD